MGGSPAVIQRPRFPRWLSRPSNTDRSRQSARAALLLSGNQRPAYDCTAYRTPAAEPFVDLRRNRGLFLERASSLDLRIRAIAHRNPARGRLDLTADEAKHRVSHFRHV